MKLFFLPFPLILVSIPYLFYQGIGSPYLFLTSIISEALAASSRLLLKSLQSLSTPSTLDMLPPTKKVPFQIDRELPTAMYVIYTFVRVSYLLSTCILLCRLALW